MKETTGLVLSALEVEKLDTIYVTYCSYGQLNRSDPELLRNCGLNLEKFCRIINDCNLGIIGDHVEAIFSSNLKENEQRMYFEDFLQSLACIAIEIYPNESKFEESIQKLLSDYVLKLYDFIQSDDDMCSSVTSVGTLRTIDTQLIPSAFLANRSCISTITSGESLGTIDTEYLPGTLKSPLKSEDGAPSPFIDRNTDLPSNQVKLDNRSTASLRHLFKTYAYHWCSDHNQTDSTSKLVKTKNWKWIQRMCIGGFRAFVFESKLIYSDDQENFVQHQHLKHEDSFYEQEIGYNMECAHSNLEIVNLAFRAGHNMTRGKSLNGCSSLNFRQFLSATATLVTEVAKRRAKRKGDKHTSFKTPFRDIIARMIRRSVYYSDQILSSLSKNHNAYFLIECNPSLLPVECRLDNSVMKQIEGCGALLRVIFSRFCSETIAKAGLAQTYITLDSNGCMGGGLESPAPVISSENFILLAHKFDIIPYFLSESQVKTLFARICNDSILQSNRSKNGKYASTSKGTKYHDYVQFVSCLAHCAVVGLSNYPHGNCVSSAEEKMALLFQRMDLSSGMVETFGPNPPSLEAFSKNGKLSKELEARLRESKMEPRKQTETNRYTQDNHDNTLHYSSTSTEEFTFNEFNPNRIPDSMTPLDAVQGLRIFENLKSRHGISNKDLEKQSKSIQGSNLHTDTLFFKKKERRIALEEVAKPKRKNLNLYSIGTDSYVTCKKSDATDSRIWSGNPKHKPHVPRKKLPLEYRPITSLFSGTCTERKVYVAENGPLSPKSQKTVSTCVSSTGTRKSRSPVHTKAHPGSPRSDSHSSWSFSSKKEEYDTLEEKIDRVLGTYG